MVREIVHTILPSQFKHNWCKKTSYANKANFRKRREQHSDICEQNEQSSETLDNAQAFAFKKQCHKQNFKISILGSILIFYICVFNVIIMCDVSVNNVNRRILKDNFNMYKRDRNFNISKIWRRHLDEKTLLKNINKSSDAEPGGKSGKYSLPELVEVNKYYSYYKNKDSNSTDDNEQSINTNQIIRNIYDDTRAVGYPHDLAKSPYYVKRTNFNLRPEGHQFHEKILKLGVLLPADQNQVLSLAKVLPIIEMAIPAITSPEGPLPGWKVLVDYRDTSCSSVEGPLAAFEFYVNGSAGEQIYILYSKFIRFYFIVEYYYFFGIADAFIGPGCEYVIAPVARYASLWRIPVITAGAQAEAFGYKQPSYMTLTRMMGSYTQAGVAIRKVFEVKATPIA